MNAPEFNILPIKEKLEIVNKMLQQESKDHLKNVSLKLDIPYAAFTKIMRDDGNYQFNQTSKTYEKIISLEEYEHLLQSKSHKVEDTDEILAFLSENLNELKELLSCNQYELVLNPKIYDVNSKSANKSIQVNLEIYNQFTELCSKKYPHLRQKDLISQCLFDFIQKYQKT